MACHQGAPSGEVECSVWPICCFGWRTWCQLQLGQAGRTWGLTATVHSLLLRTSGAHEAPAKLGAVCLARMGLKGRMRWPRAGCQQGCTGEGARQDTWTCRRAMLRKTVQLKCAYAPASPLLSGRPQPSRQGLALQEGSWRALEGHMGPLSQAFEQQDTSFFVDLGGSKRASVSAYKGKGMNAGGEGDNGAGGARGSVVGVGWGGGGWGVGGWGVGCVWGGEGRVPLPAKRRSQLAGWVVRRAACSPAPSHAGCSSSCLVAAPESCLSGTCWLGPRCASCLLLTPWSGAVWACKTPRSHYWAACVVSPSNTAA